MKRCLLSLVFAMTVAVVTAAAPPADSPIPPDSEIRKILTERIDAQRRSVGIVVGVIEPAGRRLVAYGRFQADDARPLNGHTVFEIGSITKVFTALLLADMVQRGEAAMDDPVSKYLPPEVNVPERDGRLITLQDLATHSSGLPRLPTNLTPKDPTNPYADYSVEQLYEFLPTYELTRDIGSKYEYSNLGGGLLGHVLARGAGMDYGALVRSRICERLGMNSTGITLSPEMKTRLATGHNAELAPVPNWDLPTLAGAGALRSSANDMLTFLAANLGYTKSRLTPAMAAMLTVRLATGHPGLEIALGWHVRTRDGVEIVWHNGGTGGYRSFVGYNPKARTGVVVLSNTSISADDIGRHLLDASHPLTKPPKQRKEISVDPKLFDRYVGRYQLAPKFILTVTREGDRLFTQATGQSKVEIFAESEREYFLKVVDAQITFETDSQGRATQVILHQGGQDVPGKRIEGDQPPESPQSEPRRERTEVKVDPQLFDGYVGRYQLAPQFVLTVTREGDRFFTQATGQPKVEIFPESEREYFLKVVDAQLTFETDSQGRATQVILHQNGQDMAGKRIE